MGTLNVVTFTLISSNATASCLIRVAFLVFLKSIKVMGEFFVQPAVQKMEHGESCNVKLWLRLPRLFSHCFEICSRDVLGVAVGQSSSTVLSSRLTLYSWSQGLSNQNLWVDALPDALFEPT